MSDYNDVRRIMGGEGYMNDEISRLMADAFDSGEWALWKIGGAFGTLVVGGQATGGKTAPSRK